MTLEQLYCHVSVRINRNIIFYRTRSDRATGKRSLSTNKSEYYLLRMGEFAGPYHVRLSTNKSEYYLLPAGLRREVKKGVSVRINRNIIFYFGRNNRHGEFWVSVRINRNIIFYISLLFWGDTLNVSVRINRNIIFYTLASWPEED